MKCICMIYMFQLLKFLKNRVEFDKAVEMAIEGLQPLGKEYLDIFQEGINGWMDR